MELSCLAWKGNFFKTLAGCFLFFAYAAHKAMHRNQKYAYQDLAVTFQDSGQILGSFDFFCLIKRMLINKPAWTAQIMQDFIFIIFIITYHP
jgi:hypothetical protein